MSVNSLNNDYVYTANQQMKEVNTQYNLKRVKALNSCSFFRAMLHTEWIQREYRHFGKEFRTETGLAGQEYPSVHF